MTNTFIKEQIKTIEKATKEASKSKKNALKFLQDAGIIEKNHSQSSSNKENKRQNL